MVTIKALSIFLSSSPSSSPSLPPTPSFCFSPTPINVWCSGLSKNKVSPGPRSRAGRAQEGASQERLSQEGSIHQRGHDTDILSEPSVLGTIRASKWFLPGCLFLIDEGGHMRSDRTWHVSGSLFTQASDEGKGLFWLFPASWELC